MKRIQWLVIGMLASPVAVLAQPMGVGGNQSHPCKSIVAACTAAGFEKGQYKEGKGLFKDCVQVIKNGGTVSGVTVSADDVAACKQRSKKQMGRRGQQVKQGKQAN